MMLLLPLPKRSFRVLMFAMVSRVEYWAPAGA